MNTRLALLLVFLGAAASFGAGCRPYDSYGPLVRQSGYLPADAFAAYGPEQAEAVAIGREFAQNRVPNAKHPNAEQMGLTLLYARKMPDVVSIVADTLGHRMTVSFKSGWRAAIIPIADGKRGAETPGLPPGAPTN